MHKVPLSLLAVAFTWSVTVRAQEAAASSSPAVSPPPSSVETIVFIRHGEKPQDDEGQLTCQGLNRALALPRVLLQKFGRADYVFAPLTLARQSHGKSYSYVRPLMTIEPTAISLGLPVDTRFPFDGIDQLQAELTMPSYRGAMIFVSWEHSELVLLVRHLLGALGDTSDQVPDWDKNDFDGIYIVKIRSEGDHLTAAFAADHEMLNGLSTDCPTINVPAPGDALIDTVPVGVTLISMGDKSPKANQKQKAQKQTKAGSDKNKKDQAAAAKQVAKTKK